MNTPIVTTNSMDPTLIILADAGISTSAMVPLEYSFEGNGVEMGFFFFLSLLSVMALLNKMDGKFYRIKVFLMNRDFHLIKNQHLITCITTFIRIMAWISLALPLMALCVWSAGLIVRAKSQGIKPAGGICVFMVGSAMICFLANFFKLKWNYYRYTRGTGIYFVMTFVFLTCYQFVAVFLTSTPTIFGFSVVFLAANLIVMIAIVFLNLAVKNSSIDDLIKNKLPTGASLNR